MYSNFKNFRGQMSGGGGRVPDGGIDEIFANCGGSPPSPGKKPSSYIQFLFSIWLIHLELHLDPNLISMAIRSSGCRDMNNSLKFLKVPYRVVAKMFLVPGDIWSTFVTEIYHFHQKLPCFWLILYNFWAFWTPKWWASGQKLLFSGGLCRPPPPTVATTLVAYI